MLPTVVFAAFSVYYLLRLERERVESGTLARSQLLMRLVDAELERHVAALSVLSGSVDLETAAWQDSYRRARRALRANPAWESVALIDPAGEREIFDAARPLGAPGPLAAEHREALRNGAANAVRIGGIESGEGPRIWIYVPVSREGAAPCVLAAAIHPQSFQELLVSFTRGVPIAGVVDRRGRFIARTLGYEERIGTPATEYVRDALGSASRGFYRGRTYEGLENYTAFHTSAFSGWSAHLAVASSSIDNPTRWSFVAAGLAGLGGLLLGGFLVVLVLKDMSERRRAEEALRQSQKMEAIGQLTGGIAHDFNNLLTAIIGNLDMIRRRAAENERLRRAADNALEAARRGAKLASQLLAFSRTQRMSVRPIDLSELLNGMSGLLAQSVGTNVAVHVEIDPDARYVASDPNQLELALLNLAVNARDAMKDGGSLTITARRAEDVHEALPKGAYVNLSIADSGSGMSEDVRTRAMEPFFTTKPVGQGTGLGLSQVYGVVRESGGNVSIESAVGAGTRVCLTLPVARAPALPAETRRMTSPTVPKSSAGSEPRILVVDDDRLVRHFITESLRSLDYQVVDAPGGAQALELLDRLQFDLLVLDFAMPGMNGAEVARAAREKQPDLKVLVVSGYADSAAVEAALGSAPHLRKPFDLATLGAAVAEVLNQDKSAPLVPSPSSPA